MFNQLDQNAIEEIIGYTFKDKALLSRAFTHSSYANINRLASNESLEFLGDGVLNLIVAETLYKQMRDEGRMTIARAAIVSTEPLYRRAVAMGIDKHLLSIGARNFSHKVYSDLFEAVLGAIFIDGGLIAARKFVLRTLSKEIMDVFSGSSHSNAKGMLQEYCQANKLGQVQYKKISSRGTPNSPHFVVSVTIGKGLTFQGEGSKIKLAEQAAAAAALEFLKS